MITFSLAVFLSEVVTRAAETATTTPQAAQYYAPIIGGDAQRERVTKRLEFEPVSTSVDDLRAMLREHAWRTVFHCDGAPMKAEELAKNDFADGWIKDGTQFAFGENTFTFRDLPAGSSRSKGDQRLIKGTYRIISKGAGKFRLELSKSDFSFDVTALKVKATGERVLDCSDPSFEACDDKGHSVRSLLVPELGF